ncbi:MAG: NUDIX hydrolase [Bacteroidota bacterium]|jgi:ADP-ribose pyrophosphatase YjhB (NUDIX family)|nr:NUDIX hydrolase [Bacteroidota bacterium]
MYIQKYKSHDKILLAVDCIIFGFDGKQVKALLIKRGFEPEKGKWSLMGGFINTDENVDDAAKRILKQLTGLSDIYMEQLYCFGDINRDPAGRVVSIAYYALININNYIDQLHQDHEAHWFSLDKIPSLIFDHKDMVLKAMERLQYKVANHPIGFELLPEKFTLTQLQNLYEAIYGSLIDRRNFTKKVHSLGILTKLDEKEKESSRKGAYYYTFDKEIYNKLEYEGINLFNFKG